MALSKITEIRNEQVARRLKNPTFGLGFWAAVDFTEDREVKREALSKARKAFPFSHGNWASSRHHFTYDAVRKTAELVQRVFASKSEEKRIRIQSAA